MSTIEPRRVMLANGETILIRTGVADDAPGVLAHRIHISHTSEHNVAMPDEVDTDLGKQREWLEERIGRERDLFILATADSEPGLVIGALHFYSCNRRVLAHHGDFGISVDEAWRGRGVGTALIGVLLEWARAHPTIEKVCLGVFENNVAARRLYERLGFKVEGRREKFFKMPSGYVDDLMMSIWVKAPAVVMGNDSIRLFEKR